MVAPVPRSASALGRTNTRSRGLDGKRNAAEGRWFFSMASEPSGVTDKTPRANEACPTGKARRSLWKNWRDGRRAVPSLWRSRPYLERRSERLEFGTTRRSSLQLVERQFAGASLLVSNEAICFERLPRGMKEAMVRERSAWPLVARVAA